MLNSTFTCEFVIFIMEYYSMQLARLTFSTSNNIIFFNYLNLTTSCVCRSTHSLPKDIYNNIVVPVIEPGSTI